MLAEIAICATDLAELLGTAIALELLFGIRLLAGMVLTALDAFVLLWLQHKGVRWLEAVTIGILVLISGCFDNQIALTQLEWAAVAHGYIPSLSIVTNETQPYIAMGILAPGYSPASTMPFALPA